MRTAVDIAIQVGLWFGPVIAFIFLKCVFSSRLLLVLCAFTLAFLTGLGAFHAISEHGWLIPIKYGHNLELSPPAGFWIYFTGTAIFLLCLAFYKQAEVGVVRNVGSGNPGDETRVWRVGHTGRDQMYYEEFHGGTWQQITIDGEMLTGAAHHVIYFASPEKWESYPEWARGRREEIIIRIKSEFAPPEYEYYCG